MPVKPVQFRFVTGLQRQIFRHARLSGSWDPSGRYADQGTEIPRQERVGEDGCPVFEASVALDLADKDRTFRWGVILDGPQGANFWGIPTEIPDKDSTDRYRPFHLHAD